MSPNTRLVCRHDAGLSAGNQQDKFFLHRKMLFILPEQGKMLSLHLGILYRVVKLLRKSHL